MTQSDSYYEEMKMPRLDDVKLEVCDTAGFYDTFQISDVLCWLPYGQITRDAVKALCKEGLLRRIDRGIYTWVKPIHRIQKDT